MQIIYGRLAISIKGKLEEMCRFPVLNDTSEEYVSRAKAFYLADDVSLSEVDAVPTQQIKSKKWQLLSEAYLVQSKIALARGAAHVALSYAKHAVRLLRRSWARVEDQKRRKHSTQDSCASDLELGSLTEGASNLSLSVGSNSEEAIVTSPGFKSCLWVFITPLFYGLEHLSSVYAYHGMFQETIYYAEQGYKLAKDMDSAAHQALSVAAIGTTLMKAGSVAKGSEMLMELKSLSTAVQGSQNVATLAYCTGKMHAILGDQAAELASYELAESVLEVMLQVKQVDQPLVENTIDTIEGSMAKMSISQTKTTTRRKPAPRGKVPSKVMKTVTRAKTPTIDEPAPVVEECAHLLSFQATILRSKALVLHLSKRSGEAQALLDRAASFVHTQVEALDHRLAMAKQLLFLSMESMTADPVYSVLQDSTISFPSISTHLKGESIGDRLSIVKASPPRKANASKSRATTRIKASSSEDFFEKLQQAQEYLLEAHTIAIAAAPVALIHTISALLNSVSILLSASGHLKGRGILSPGFASCTIGKTCSFVECGKVMY
jgi:separase